MKNSKLNVNLIETTSKKLCMFLFLILMKNITTIGQHFHTNITNHHQLYKRMDLESCLGQFDVHHDTIIRTEESQAIGGKYLQGIGLNNLDECQRLCCETEHCDVYIFEEKSEGYCYLFECGPPENFHCKFTRHANYTSAVLTPTIVIKHMTSTPPPPPVAAKSSNIIHSGAQIPPAVSLSQHELELTNLKQKPSEMNLQQAKVLLQLTTIIPSVGIVAGGGAGGIGMDGNSGGTAGRGIISGSSGIRLTDQIATPKTVSGPQLNNVSVCGRFQFQCHSGECIAVYNACDGIPQCEDGSDEGPECPATTGIEAKSMNSETSKLNDMITNYRIPSGGAASVALSKQTMQVLPRQYQQQSIQIPIINNREDPLSSPPVWPNRKGQDIQPDIERNSRIFNHKGGLQLSTNNVGGSPQYINNPASSGSSNIYNPTLQRDIYNMQNDLQNGYRNATIQPQDHLIPPPNINWQQAQIQQQQQQQSLIPPGPYIISVNGQPVPQIKSIPSVPQQHQQQPQIVNNNNNNDVQMKSDTSKTNNDPLTSSQFALEPNNDKKNAHRNQKDHHNSKNNKEKGIGASAEESDDYSYYEDKSTEPPPKKKLRKHKKLSTKDKEINKSKNEEGSKEEEKGKSIESPVHERYKMIKEDLEMEFVDHDGQSERPGGAVLSLTLGIIVTAALAILIGCRMRTVSRRVRRMGKAPFAHDADFLVNGMYL